MPCDCQRKNAETGNFGFGINEHIDLRLKYEPNIYIYGMDFFNILARKRKRVPKRKHQRSRLGNFQKVTKENAKNWFKEKLNRTIIKYIIKIINNDNIK